MFTVTFYSYKGGVGRTSALMNVATRLASLGKRVCVLDFDLEAPGLDSFGLPHPDAPMSGVVEYIDDFLKTEKIPDIQKYVYEIPLDTKGALFLVPAGRKDSNYQRSLSHLDWKLLYKQKNGALIVEALRRVVARDLKIDYFLIDSRTGLTDVAGIATLQLPDLVVMLFNLNDQNIKGTAQVYKTISDNRLNRSIRTLLVASPIPEIPEFLQLRSTRFNRARTIIGSAPELIIPYDPFVCFQETIIDEQQSRSLSKAYDDLTQKIIGLNDKDVINLLKQARNLWENGEMQLADLKYQEILDLYPTDGEVWFQYGRFARIKGDYELASRMLAKAVEVSGGNESPLSELALTQLQLGDSASARESYLRLVETSSNLELISRVSKTLADKGEAKLAHQGMSRAMEKDPGPAGKWTQAEMALRTGDFAQSSDIFEKLSKARRDLAPTFNAAYAAWRDGRPNARRLFHNAIAIFEASDLSSQTPRSTANVYGAIAFAYSLMGDPVKARLCLETAIGLAEEVDDKVMIYSFPEYEDLTKELFINGVRSRLVTLLASGEDPLIARARGQM